VSAPAELVLVANARLPSARAQSLQVMQAAAAFARANVRTTLLHARRHSVPDIGGRDLFDYYAVPAGPRPEVVSVDCVDWIDRVPRRWQFVPSRLQELTFARNAARWVARERPRSAVLSRELETARHLIRRGRRGVFLEMHRVPQGGLRRRWLEQAAAGAGGLLAISGGVARDLAWLGLPAPRLRVEHDALDPARFSGLPPKAEARRRLGLVLEEPLVVYTGGLMDWKGVDVLVAAARLLPRARFAIAGGQGADVERLRAAAAGLANVRIDGFRPPEEVPLYLAAGDVAVVPNRSAPAIAARYTSPLKVFEAMAAGTPLVVSDLPALREILSPEQAVFVAADDPQALAEGIGRLLGDPPLRARIAAALRAGAEGITWDARAARILAWIEGLA
jgi:glycosyltransferase involved in cell wall biosynthesis